MNSAFMTAVMFTLGFMIRLYSSCGGGCVARCRISDPSSSFNDSPKIFTNSCLQISRGARMRHQHFQRFTAGLSGTCVRCFWENVGEKTKKKTKKSCILADSFTTFEFVDLLTRKRPSGRTIIESFVFPPLGPTVRTAVLAAPAV